VRAALFWTYVVAYIGAQARVEYAWRHALPLWLRLARASALSLELVGMLLFGFAVPVATQARLAWRPALAFMLVVAVTRTAYHHHWLLEGGFEGLSRREFEAPAAAGIAAVIILEVPALWVNFRLAFNG